MKNNNDAGSQKNHTYTHILNKQWAKPGMMARDDEKKPHQQGIMQMIFIKLVVNKILLYLLLPLLVG